MAKLTDIQDINAFPFSEVMERAGTSPVLLDSFVPELDLVIWKMRPCKCAWTTDDLRLMVLWVLDQAVEEGLQEPGAMAAELDGYDFFVFPSKLRSGILKEMGMAASSAQSDLPTRTRTRNNLSINLARTKLW